MLRFWKRKRPAGEVNNQIRAVMAQKARELDQLEAILYPRFRSRLAREYGWPQRVDNLDDGSGL
jgi:hypothetical protein